MNSFWIVFAGLVILCQVLAQGDWTQWAEWTKACTDCTEKVRGRTRVCVPAVDGTLCSGNRVEFEDCCASAAWAEWSSYSNCSDYCGNCGKRQRERECQTFAGCPLDCVGDAVEEDPVPCDSGTVCLHPRIACCKGTKKAFIEERRYSCVE